MSWGRYPLFQNSLIDFVKISQVTRVVARGADPWTPPPASYARATESDEPNFAVQENELVGGGGGRGRKQAEWKRRQRRRRRL